MSHFLIGWAESDITPEKKVSLVGQFAERIAECAEKPLTATAMALSVEGEQAVLVSCDLVSVSLSLVDAVRERLADNDSGLDPRKVVISATHTHTGPGYAGRGDFSGASSSFRSLIERCSWRPDPGGSRTHR